MIDTVKKLSDLLDRSEKRQAGLLLIMILFMALLEAAGVVSIMPFMAVVGNPTVIDSNRILSWLYDGLEFESKRNFLIFLGSSVFAVVVVSLTFKAVTMWALLRYTFMRNHAIACRLLQKYFARPYIWFLDRHSADLGKTILSEVDQVVNHVLRPLLHVVAYSLVALFIMILVVLADPMVAVITIVALGGTYVAMFSIVRKYLDRIGVERLHANRERFQVAQEALGGIKDVKALGVEDNFLLRFENPSLAFASRQAASQIVAQVPQFALQGMAFGGVVLIVLYLLASYDEIGNALPLMGLYAFAGYRLLPALQQIYQNLTKLRFSKAALDALHKDFGSGESSSRPVEDGREEEGKLPCRDEIRLADVVFRYPDSHESALNGMNLAIPANTTVGLVGKSGSGKTTAMDLLLGMLEPQVGHLMVDDEAIVDANRRSWQRNLGYVPQHIYLSDDSIAANIAFGRPEEEWDRQSIENAARSARLHDFVVNELPQGYETKVGERGVRLSGGQRQRIGIARALYKSPDVLIFDEATSALDTVTEKAVMEAIKGLQHQKTIIIIAHRMTTVRSCDKIFVLKEGSVVAEGVFDELIENDECFRELSEGVSGNPEERKGPDPTRHYLER